MKKPVIKYMHTVNGLPGSYEGGQICFATNRPLKLCDTLDQIRKEELASYAWRESKGFETRSSYNYVRVKVS